MKRSIILFSTFVMFFSCSRTPVIGPAVPVNLQDGHFEVTLDDVEGFIDLVTVLDDDVFGARINALDTVRMVFTARDNGHFDAVRGFCPDCQKIADDCRAAWTAYVNTRPGSDMPDMEMLSPEGTAVLLSSLFGKVIYIDMWATWCGPCVKETPYMAALAERMKKRDDILCKG